MATNIDVQVIKFNEEVYIMLPNRKFAKRIGYVRNRVYWTFRPKLNWHIYHKDNSVRLSSAVIDQHVTLGFDAVDVAVEGKHIRMPVEDVQRLPVESSGGYEKQYVIQI